MKGRARSTATFSILLHLGVESARAISFAILRLSKNDSRANDAEVVLDSSSLVKETTIQFVAA